MHIYDDFIWKKYKKLNILFLDFVLETPENWGLNGPLLKQLVNELKWTYEPIFFAVHIYDDFLQENNKLNQFCF